MPIDENRYRQPLERPENMPRQENALRMGVCEWVLLTVLAAVWGGSFFFVETVVDDLGPLTIVLLRVGLAAPVLWALIVMTGRPLPGTPSVWGAFLAMGVLNNAIPFSLIVWGQTGIASGVASILNAMTPMFTVLVAGVLLKDEKITPLKLIGVGAGIVGVAVMMGPDILSNADNSVLAQLAILGAAISYAFAAVFGRRFKRMQVDPVVVAAGQVSASTLVLLPMVLVFEHPYSAAVPGFDVWLAIIALAVLSTAMAYVIYFRLLETAGATNLMLVTLLVPVFAVLLGTVFLGEVLGVNGILGMVLIGLGLLVIDGRLVRRLG